MQLPEGLDVIGEIERPVLEVRPAGIGNPGANGEEDQGEAENRSFARISRGPLRRGHCSCLIPGEGGIQAYQAETFDNRPAGRSRPGCGGPNPEGILVIIKTEAVGINTALNRPTSAVDIVDRSQTNKDKKKANSMLNKLNKRRGGFTLVEIMIVVAIIALLAAIAVPGFLRARKRSQASRIINDLRLIDSAVDQYAIETNKASGAAVTTVGLDQLPQGWHQPLPHRQGHPGQRLRSADRRHHAEGADEHLQRAVGRDRQYVLVALQLRI